MNLFTRIFLLLLLLALLPVIATGVWVLNSSAGVQENAQQLHQQLAALTAQMGESAAGELNRNLAFVEDLERNVRLNPAVDAKILQRAAAGNGSLLLLSLSDAQGREVGRLADPDLFPRGAKDEPRDALVAKAQESGRVTIGPVSVQAGIPMVRLAHPLLQDRVLYVAYSLAALWKRVSKLQVGRSGRLLLLDGLGQPLRGIADDFPKPAWGGKPPFLEEDAKAGGWLDGVRTEPGITMVGAYAKVPSLDLWAMSLQPRAEAFSRSESFAAQVLSFLLVLSLIVGGAAYWLTKSLTKPILQLTSGAQRASQNDFRTTVPEIGWGELGVLANNFNKMMETLRAYQELQVERIMEEKARVTALVHNIPDGILLAGFDGRIVYMNAVARLILGIGASPAPQSVNQPLHEVLTDPDLRELAVALTRRRKRTMSAEVELKAPDGSSRGVFSCHGVTVSAENRDIGILILLRDITLERNLAAMKEEFFQSIVHDLRSPLSSISAFMQLMQSSATLPSKERTYMGYALQATKRLKDLVTDILDMAKLESGTMRLQYGAAPVQDILESIKGLYSLPAEEKRVQLGFSLGPAPHTVECDRHLVERVVMNLVGNALKFTPEGGKVSLDIGSADGQMQFCVSDTGPGIPKTGLKTIFEKFKQLEGAKMRSGYGLGLSICQKIVELHRGTIWVESEEGKGSRFIFRLPLRP